MSILFTGGLGYIPTNTITSFVDHDKSNLNNIIIMDNLSNSNLQAVQNLRLIYPEINIKTYLPYDARDYEKTKKIFTENKINTVIHFAALKSVGESVKNPLEYYDNNINSLLNLLKVISDVNENNIKFIFSSSATVYGSSEPPLLETSQIGVGITNPYGQTKFMAECILEDYAKVNKNFDCVILRYFNPVGGHSSGLLNENGKGIPNNLMPYVIKVAKGEYPQLNIFGDDYPTEDGTCERDYIHVIDLGNAHYKAWLYLQNKQTNNNYNVFNIGTGKATSVKQIVETFEKVNDLKINKKIVSRREGDLPVVYCNADKAKNILNWKAEKTLEDMCRI
jgi:UDP-glucose 4-epimerase